MAKLSAHGYELARLTKSARIGDTDYKVVLSFRSDGHILRNLTALGIHDTRYGGSPDHTYGWKLYKKLKANTHAEALLPIAREWRDQSAASGNLIDFKECVL
jgi:hypothetical protein